MSITSGIKDKTTHYFSTHGCSPGSAVCFVDAVLCTVGFEAKKLAAIVEYKLLDRRWQEREGTMSRTRY